MNSELPSPGTRLFELVAALREVAEVSVHGPAQPELEITSCLVLDAAEAELAPGPEEVGVGVLLVTGMLTSQVGLLREVVAARRPGVLLVQADGSVPVPSWPGPLLTVPEGTRWSQVVGVVTRFAHSAARLMPGTPGSDVGLSEHTDLFGLAKTLGTMTGTLISIEDDQARVLAFSPFSDQADPIRKLAILGREPPQWHVEQLRSQGVFDRLRRPEATVELAASGDLRARLGTGMHDPTTGAYLGTIWAQETEQPLGADLGEYLLAAARYAAHVISRTRLVHTLGTELVQRLLAPDPNAEMPFGQQLSLEAPEEFTVVGFEDVGDPATREWLASSEAVAILSMHAGSARDHALVAPHNSRLYAVLPGPPEVERHAAWAERTLGVLERYRSTTLRAAISSSLSATSVAAARAEIERVCATAAYSRARPVVTLDNERTAVLLTEALSALPRELLLDDARLEKVLAYDRTHDVSLLETVGVWLSTHGDVAASARVLLTHTNTVRYRLARLEKVSGYHLDQADDRLLLQLQIRLLRRGGSTRT